jgi:hypothetical protein
MCDNRVMQTVPTKWDYKQIEMKCGSTDIHGGTLLCEDCAERGPWYICRHGNDVSEYDCGACEFD